MSRKKKKKRQEAPPLSTLDKGIYIALIIILLFLSAALAIDWSYWAAKFSDTWVEPVALQRDGGDFIVMFAPLPCMPKELVFVLRFSEIRP